MTLLSCLNAPSPETSDEEVLNALHSMAFLRLSPQPHTPSSVPQIMVANLWQAEPFREKGFLVNSYLRGLLSVVKTCSQALGFWFAT